MDNGKENPATTRFREYLRINTMQPTPDYDSALKYLEKQALDLGLEFRVLESGEKDRSVALMTWKGQKPELQSILLTSHIDVVPVFPDQWKYDPFSAHKDENGDIFARGAQDMKCVSCWYLEAIRRLKAEGKTCLRTIYLLFTSDEEIGSRPSQFFSTSEEFKKLNAVFGLDEGIANPGNKVRVFYGERSIWWIKVVCRGQPGHGSQFLENTAAKKLQYIINKFNDLRDAEEKKFKAHPEKGLGAVKTVNMTIIEGGVQPNVVPDKLSATFDMRVDPFTDFAKMKAQIQQWCEEAGSEVTYEFLQYGEMLETVCVTDENPWWKTFSGVCKELGLDIQTEIFPAGTDSRFFRKANVDMLGFSPMNNTPILLHDHNEFLNEKIFLRGIDIYEKIIPALANFEA